MSNTTKRRNILSDLLGKITPKNHNEVLGQLQSLLDKQGVERKEFDMGKAKGVLEDTIIGINEAIAPLSDNIPEDIAPKILALVMGALADMPVAPVEEEVEVMAEGEEVEEDEEEELPEAMMELAEQVKALAHDNTEIVKDVNEMVNVMKRLAEGYSAIAPLVGKADEYAQMMKKVERLEGIIDQTPRSASSAKDTEIDNADVLNAMKTGTEGKKSLLGLNVKE